jgi:N-ethylmaleimide reductase
MSLEIQEIQDSPISITEEYEQPLLRPVMVGDLEMKNRVVMSALSRFRADYKTRAPNELHAEYYSARSSSAMIITECSSISPEGDSTRGSACIFSDEQVEGWKRVTDAVHKKDGRIYLQLWHAGRACDPNLTGVWPISASPVLLNCKQNPLDKCKKHVVPREATKEDIEKVLEDYKKASINAKKAGFDGVELHAAHGYLLDQFLRDGTNKRTDEFGGSIENRARFCLLALDIIIEVFGP